MPRKVFCVVHNGFAQTICLMSLVFVMQSCVSGARHFQGSKQFGEPREVCTFCNTPSTASVYELIGGADENSKTGRDQQEHG